MLDILGYDTRTPGILNDLKTLTFTDEQVKKLSADYKVWTEEYGTEKLSDDYSQQFRLWVIPGGGYPAPDLAQIMGTSATETDLAEEDPLAGATTTDPVVYDPVTLPDRKPFTLSEDLESQLAVTAQDVEAAAEKLEGQRREYFDQYEASAILAKSEQDRSALGQLRGQMMARQGLMGSPLGVGLGLQQETQMRGLAMQEVGRGRAAMEMQLAEQAFRRQETAADRALQAQQFGTTTQLQLADLDLRTQQLEATAALEEATLAVRQEEFGTTTQLQQASQDLQREQMEITTRLNETQQQLETDRSKVAEDLANADLALRTEQFGADKASQQRKLDLEEDKFEAQKKLDKIDRDFRESELEASLLRADADDRYREKSLGVKTALERMQLLLDERALDVGTEEQRLNRDQRERQMEATIGLEEASLALSGRQLDFNKTVEAAKQLFLDRKLQVETGLEVTDQQLRQDQFQANLLIEQHTLAYQKHEADATRHLATLELGLKERQITDTARLQETNQALQTAVQQFNESQSRVNNAVTQAELSLRREDLELSRLQLDQAYSNQTAAQGIARDTMEQTGKLAKTRDTWQAVAALGTILAVGLPIALRAAGLGDWLGDTTASTVLTEKIDSGDLEIIIEGFENLGKQLDELLQPQSAEDSDIGRDDKTPAMEGGNIGSARDEDAVEDEDAGDNRPASDKYAVETYQPGQSAGEDKDTEGYTSVLQAVSGSGDEMYGVSGTPPATEVASRLRSIIEGDSVSNRQPKTIGAAITHLLEGFNKGYSLSGQEPTDKMRVLMDDLSNLRSDTSGALRADEVYTVINKHLSGTASLGADDTTTNGTTAGAMKEDGSSAYQEDQNQQINTLIMMADSSGDYGQDAMIDQFNKTDLKKLITAMRNRTPPPFTLTRDQVVALDNLSNQRWFQAALKADRKGGNT